MADAGAIFGYPHPAVGQQEDVGTDLAESVRSDDEDEEVAILLGPSQTCTAPFLIHNLRLPSRRRFPGPMQSNEDCIALSDILRLSEARSEFPLSFGSAKHIISGSGEHCRPCMFERRAGRCSKAWLCDFCHLHTKQTAKPTTQQGGHKVVSTAASPSTAYTSGGAPQGSHHPPDQRGYRDVTFVRLSL
mmetsp:Transcript_55066/g.131223  ORF Transcript_55066/g.131223 Transcript_55066/m.131223 type:complete len:189 (+) Transcript_55066:112-678(+)